MKKIVSILLVLTMFVSLGTLVACSGETDVTTKATTVSREDKTTEDMTDESKIDSTDESEEESMTGNVEITTTDGESKAETTKS